MEYLIPPVLVTEHVTQHNSTTLAMSRAESRKAEFPLELGTYVRNLMGGWLVAPLPRGYVRTFVVGGVVNSISYVPYLHLDISASISSVTEPPTPLICPVPCCSADVLVGSRG